MTFEEKSLRVQDICLLELGGGGREEDASD